MAPRKQPRLFQFTRTFHAKATLRLPARWSFYVCVTEGHLVERTSGRPLECLQFRVFAVSARSRPTRKRGDPALRSWVTVGFSLPPASSLPWDTHVRSV